MNDSRQVRKREEIVAGKDLQSRLKKDVEDMVKDSKYLNEVSVPRTPAKLSQQEYEAYHHILNNISFEDCFDGNAIARRMFEAMWNTMRGLVADLNANVKEAYEVSANSTEAIERAKYNQALIDIIKEMDEDVVSDAKEQLEARIAEAKDATKQ